VPLVKQIAAKYKKHVLSLLLRWGIQRGNSCLAKSSNPHHIRGNLEGCLGWTISKEDMTKLSTLDFQLRLVDGIRFLRPEGPFR
jgi:diketogulonate reductase-like aldo/keto reductase